jgi:thiol-disulfide isomerase/thioredoxin
VAKLKEAKGLFDAKRYGDAIKTYERAQKLAVGPCLQCFVGLAQTYRRVGAYREVLKNVDAALGLTEDRAILAPLYNEQGLALAALAGDDAKRLAAAEKAFRQALEMSGDTANPTRFNLGFTLLRLGRDEEGVALLQSYLQGDANPKDAELARVLIANPVRARKRLVEDFHLVTLTGESLSFDGLRGKVLLFDFWGTWCAPCRAAAPALRDLGRRMADDPFVLISISTDADEAALRRYVAKEGMTWPQVWDKGQSVTHRWGVEQFPTYLLVSPEGEILSTLRGWSDSVNKELHSRVYSAIRDAKKSAKQAAGGSP